MTEHRLSDKGEEVVNDIKMELLQAAYVYPAMTTAHDGFGVMYEEFTELQEHIFMKPYKRDVAKMRKEAVQVAAMAIRFIIDICETPKANR